MGMAAMSLALGNAEASTSANLDPNPPSFPRRTQPKQGKRNMLRGYYNRYSNAMTEMKLHTRFRHPFSDKKRRPL
jgi:hypothetical protein